MTWSVCACVEPGFMTTIMGASSGRVVAAPAARGRRPTRGTVAPGGPSPRAGSALPTKKALKPRGSQGLAVVLKDTLSDLPHPGNPRGGGKGPKVEGKRRPGRAGLVGGCG